MKLKKILLPIFIGTALLMASFISVVSGIGGNIKVQRRTSAGVVSSELNGNIRQDTQVITADSGDNLFEITTHDDLEYTGEEQLLITITPLDGTVYYRVVEGEYASSNALTSSNYTSYSSGSAGETIEIKATEIGTYTVYYYVPASATYNEISSSATVSIVEPKQSNLFEISVSNGLVYNGSEQTLMTITPRTGSIYYRVESGEYNEDYALYLGNHTNYTSSSANTTVTISATNAGTYTVYYYIPENDDYKEVSSSSTVTIESVSTNLTINPNGGTWNGTTSNSTISQTVGSSYSIQAPTGATGYHFTNWSGSTNVIEPVALKDEVMTFDGVDDYINLGRDYMYEDKLF
ncbi:MAG: hypothetical protein IJ458_01120, partial [Clostridia bacterium]|nr:hypothetical protein [Clostridia bacterium]